MPVEFGLELMAIIGADFPDTELKRPGFSGGGFI